jgi:hypothetical protein
VNKVSTSHPTIRRRRSKPRRTEQSSSTTKTIPFNSSGKGKGEFAGTSESELEGCARTVVRCGP